MAAVDEGIAADGGTKGGQGRQVIHRIIFGYGYVGVDASGRPRTAARSPDWGLRRRCGRFRPESASGIRRGLVEWSA